MERLKRQRSFRYLQWSLVIAALLVIAAPMHVVARQDATPVVEGGGGTLTGAFDVGPGGCVECFNPMLATAGFTWLEKYYSKLVQYDINFTEISGDLAESWEISEDGKQYTFSLRPGVTWHDGEAFTAEDVKFSIELIKNPDSASYFATRLGGVSAVNVVDDQTVTFDLAEPNAAFLDTLTFITMLPEHALKDIPAADLVQSTWWSTSPIGTGPFKWNRYEPSQFVELVAFDTYWRGRPKLDSIINRYYPEPGSAVIALRAGDIDFSYLAFDEAQAMEGSEGFTVLSGPSQVTNYLYFDLTEPRFQDLRVRQAFMYAIDRAAIVEQLYQGSATVVPCIYGNPNFHPADPNSYGYDPEMARSLLTEAGWESIKGEPIELLTYYSDQLSQDVLVTMQQMLADVGIEITIRTLDGPAYTETVGNNDNWSLNYAGLLNGPDPNAVSTYYISTSVPPTGSNYNRTNIPELDTLYPQGRLESDPAARAEIYQQICQILNEQLPSGWMWVGQRFGAVSDDVQNFQWTPAPAGGRYYDAVETWTVTG